MSAGTGGTLAGISRYIKERTQEGVSNNVRVVLADPPGSSLFNFVKHGVCWAPQQAERKVRKHRYDTIAEGIGLDRVTRNLAAASIDDAVQVSDQDALNMAHFLMHREGLFVGSSSAMNVAAAVIYAASLPKGAHVVTVLCDSGQRHTTRFWNEEFARREFQLTWPTCESADVAVREMALRCAPDGIQ
jgi:cysteine synthase A